MGHPYRWIILNKSKWTIQNMTHVYSEIEAYPDSNLIVASQINETSLQLNQRNITLCNDFQIINVFFLQCIELKKVLH